MTATVVATATAVNSRVGPAADYGCHHWQARGVATIGDRIEEARALRGYGQRELARLAGQPAEGARIDEEEAAREARQVEGEKRVREAEARGEKLSLAKAMKQIRDEGRTKK